MACRREYTKITADNVLPRLACIAFADLRNYVKCGLNGVTVLDSKELSDDMAVAVAEVTETRT